MYITSLCELSDITTHARANDANMKNTAIRRSRPGRWVGGQNRSSPRQREL